MDAERSYSSDWFLEEYRPPPLRLHCPRLCGIPQHSWSHLDPGHHPSEEGNRPHPPDKSNIGFQKKTDWI